MIKHGYKLIGISVFLFVVAFMLPGISGFLLFVLVPLFAFSGVFFIVKGRQTTTGTIVKPPSPYRFANTLLLASIASALVAFGIVMQIRIDTGYSGSEAEIAAVPFIFVFYLLVPMTGMAYLGSFIRKKRKK